MVFAIGAGNKGQAEHRAMRLDIAACRSIVASDRGGMMMFGDSIGTRGDRIAG